MCESVCGGGRGDAAVSPARLSAAASCTPHMLHTPTALSCCNTHTHLRLCSTPLAAVYRAHIKAAIAAHEAAGVGGSNNNNNDSHVWGGGSSDDDDSGSMACSSVGSTSSRGGGGGAASPPGAARRLAVLLMEPVLQGAGGMLLVDPLFQAVAVQVRPRAHRHTVRGGCRQAGGAALGPRTSARSVRVDACFTLCVPCPENPGTPHHTRHPPGVACPPHARHI